MTMSEKYFNSETKELKRSEITLAEYNPRTISKEGRAALKRSIKTFGVVGGIIWNKRTGVLVGGHQKISVLDELNKYNPETKENDYILRVEVIDVDEKTEKELNITLNNPNVGGDWDYDKLRELVPDIDYKTAGLTDEDLSLIGFDFSMQTEIEKDLASEFEELNKPIVEQREAEKEARKQTIKEAKQAIRDQAEEKARDLYSYVMLNFESYEAKSNFMIRFGYNPMDKVIKGEIFSNQIERVE